MPPGLNDCMPAGRDLGCDLIKMKLHDRKAHNPGAPLEPGPFAQVVDILERSPGRGILGEAGSTLE